MKVKKLATAALVLSLSALGLSGPLAAADTTDQTKVNGASQTNASNAALINPTATVQLNITKFLGGATSTTPHNGGYIADPALPKLQGVKFDVYKVATVATPPGAATPLDLTTNAGWEAASATAGYIPTAAEITAKAFTAGGKNFTLTGPTTVTTNGSGLATFTQANGVGLYFVVENLASSGTITNLTTSATVDKTTVTASKPFFVTLPLTNPTNTSQWWYDVYVYPKNQSDTATKKVVDNGTTPGQAGSKSTYVIETSITPGMDGTTMNKYEVYDSLDPRLTYDTTKVEIVTPTPTESLALLATPADYALTSGPDAAPNATRTLITVKMTPAGLTKLATAKAAGNKDAFVRTTITATVKADTGNGTISNKAEFIPNKPWSDQNTGKIPSTETITKYGDVAIEKYDPKAGATPSNMNGAEFKIYVDPTPGDGVCSATDVAGTALATATIDNGAKPTTDPTYNRVSFHNLQVSNWLNGAELPATPKTAWRTYCIVETKAPTGFTLNATPVVAEILADTGGTATANAVLGLRIANEKSNLGNDLPLTGGEGVAALSLGGLLLIGGGIAYYTVTKRRREDS